MKKILLPNNKFTLVDEEDFEKVNSHHWHIHSKEGYVIREVESQGKRTVIRLSRFIMGDPEGMVVDHINGDKLNNSRSNLRICTKAENNRNRKGTRKYKGAYYSKIAKKWFAAIRSNGKTKTLGYFMTEIDAARCYDKAARELFGEFARLNFSDC